VSRRPAVAEEALRLGLVTAVVRDEALLEEARARLAAILQRGAEAYGLAKRLLNLAAARQPSSRPAGWSATAFD
jgi:enoyl-CoA hydratase/carnithine racemase